MRRKLIQHGPHSLGVSLPANWLRRNSLEKGDNVTVVETERGLFISEYDNEKEKEVVLDISDYNDSYLTKRINQLYEDGYSKIILRFNKREIRSPSSDVNIDLKTRLEYLANRLIGLEIVNWKRNEVHLQFMFSSSKLSLDEIKSKIRIMILYGMNTLEESVKNSDSEALEMGQEIHDNITRFVSLGKREIKLTRASRADYLLLVILDKIADHLRHGYANAKNCSPEVADAIRDINKPYRLFDEAYKKKDVSKLNSALMERADVYKKILKQTLPAFVYLYAGILEMVILLVENTVMPETSQKV